jgi:lipase
VSLLNVHAYGPDDALPVLALHGVTGHCFRWRVLADALPEVRLVAVDLRGHGRSPWTPPWSLEQHVTDVLDTLDHLGLGPLPVIGHSFGGAISLHLARVARERLTRLVLIDPALGLDAQDMLETAQETCAGESYADVAEARAERARRWDGVPDAQVDGEIADHLVEVDGRWRYRYCTPAVVTAWGEMARPAVLPPADLPTLLLPAAKADFVDPAWVAQLGPLVTVQEFDAGHMVYLERPGEVAAAVRAFLG